VGVDERDNSAEFAEMTSERTYVVDGVARKVRLLLLVVENEKKEGEGKEEKEEEGEGEELLLCSILAMVVMIGEALQDK
jgi:hypothetical protein